MSEKFKQFLGEDGVFYTLLIILIAIASFGLGRMSVERDLEPLNTQTNNQALTALSSLEVEVEAPEVKGGEMKSGTKVIASRSGTKYHLPDCAGAKQIKSENRIEFESVEAAKAAGYSPAANCPGL